MVRLIAHLLEQGRPASVQTGTDVLRLAAGLSDGDVGLRAPARLRTFTRPERRFLLGLLEEARHLEDDIARRPEAFKRLFFALKPGDHAGRFPRSVAAYDRLYRGALPPTWAARVEAKLEARDPAALRDLEARPGAFLRRLHRALLLYGEEAGAAFLRVLDRLSVPQLLRIRRYLATVNDRRFPSAQGEG